ncbi:YbgA family protein [Parahaliea aestuarii]|uniref:DUF523 and DUF1722 domain-containing protein n=1 Tax=Parahaliea aestuarii TaxID=1852021 RepID=A0A5C8ZUZ4_9GAMM|nr:DUF523 and DUF1722 domain-containing protein [Parahaliea aestuarii]TXS91091.1 DUF523 and DUF1722 domain-containing protein [Parahaliea aestuarii]
MKPEEYPTTDTSRPVVGIGACLNGQPVRYDGSQKRAHEALERMKQAFALRPFCPEVGIGMGVPRPPIHLVGSDADQVRALDVATHQRDYTDALDGFARDVLSRAPELCGYILVKNSPSCGYARVKRYNEKGNPVGADSQGIFAAALQRAAPLLPLEDDGRLHDPGLRDSFIARVFAYHDWHQCCASGLNAGALIAFYSRYKYQVMAHSVSHYREIGRLLANAGKRDISALASEFISLLMDALSRRATVRSHTNVLFHISGYLKRELGDAERQRLKALIDDYRQGLIPLVVPITMLRHHFANHPDRYIAGQTYLQPYPDELGLRNHL